MLSIFFFNRDFTPRAAQPAADWRVERMTWAALGGPERAELCASPAAPLIPALWADLLRCPVEISQDGLPVWWGYVNAAALRSGGRLLRVSLDDCATCVRVDWKPSADSPAVSVFARDDSQIDRFGEKQFYLNQGTSGDSLSAQSIADGWLAQLSPSAARWRSAAGAQTDALQLELRGWWHTLGWRYREAQGEGASAWEAAPDEDHALGSSANNARGAQPFTSPAQPLDWRAYTLRVNLRKAGSPTDRVRISIQADAAGSPAGIELDWVEIPATLMTASLEWYDLRFDNLLAAVLPGQKYHVVFQRTGSPNATNYYRVGLDLLPVPLPGVHYYKLFNGSTWTQRSPNAAAVYALQGASDSLQLARFYAGAARGGQFLTDVQLDGTAGRYLPVQKSAVFSYLREITELLRLGGREGERTLAEITPRRGLRILRAAAPDAVDAVCPVIAEDGSLCSASGAALPLWQARAGLWADDPGLPGLPVFLERIVWDGARLRAG